MAFRIYSLKKKQAHRDLLTDNDFGGDIYLGVSYFTFILSSNRGQIYWPQSHHLKGKYWASFDPLISLIGQILINSHLINKNEYNSNFMFISCNYFLFNCLHFFLYSWVFELAASYHTLILPFIFLYTGNFKSIWTSLVVLYP